MVRGEGEVEVEVDAELPARSRLTSLGLEARVSPWGPDLVPTGAPGAEAEAAAAVATGGLESMNPACLVLITAARRSSMDPVSGEPPGGTFTFNPPIEPPMDWLVL